MAVSVVGGTEALGVRRSVAASVGGRTGVRRVMAIFCGMGLCFVATPLCSHVTANFSQWILP